MVEEEVGWNKDLQSELINAFKFWPKDERDVKDIIKVSNMRKNDWVKLDEALDQNGMVRPVPGSDAKSCQSCNFEFTERLPWCSQCRQPRPDVVWKVAGTILYPGDTLLQTGENGIPLHRVKSEPRLKKSIFFYSHL